MKNRPLLFQANPEALGGNGAAATAAPVTAPVAENVIPLATAGAAAAAESPAPVETEQKGGFLQGVLAAVSSKSDLLQQIGAEKLRAEQAIQEVTALKGELATAQETIATLQAQNKTLTEERQQIEQALQAAQGQVQGEQVAVAKVVASMGFEAEQLPAASGQIPDTKEAIQARLATETNCAERHKLALQLLEMD